MRTIYEEKDESESLISKADFLAQKQDSSDARLSLKATERFLEDSKDLKLAQAQSNASYARELWAWETITLLSNQMINEEALADLILTGEIE